MCTKCSVQTGSKFAMDKFDNLVNEMGSEHEGKIPEPQNASGVYCSTGKAACQYLNPKEQYICPTCTVWQEYNLQTVKPVMYFCQRGNAV